MRDRRINNLPIFLARVAEVGLNPFVPTDRKELDKLQKSRTKRILFGKVKKLWERQDGKCPNCNQRITEESDWNTHHIQPKAQGGNNELDNLILVHSACHKQIHNPTVLPGFCYNLRKVNNLQDQ
jgi:5-methylcytosine-specific restriction endonuclease McrA